MAERNKYLNKIELGFVHAVREETCQYGLLSEEAFPQYKEVGSPDELKNTKRAPQS